MPPKKNADTETVAAVGDDGKVVNAIVDPTPEQLADANAVEPDRAEIAAAPAADTSAEFPTAWHRDAFVDGLNRELAGANRRVEELTAVGAHPDAIEDAQTMADNAAAELARLKKA